MATNQIALITKFSEDAWDKVYKQEAVTSALDANKDLVKFTGAKTVKIGKWMNGGLHNYYRNNSGDPRVAAPSGSFVGSAGFGYKASAARLIWEEFTLRQDRGAAFEIEYFDNEESGGNLVGTGVAEISRTTIVPEVDAYCLSTVAGYTSTNLQNKVAENIVYANASTNQNTPIAALNAGITSLKKHEVKIEDMIAFCSCDFMNALRNTQEGGVYKPLTQSDFGKDKDVSFEITKYMGITLIEVAPERLRTNIQLIDSDDGGFYWPTVADVANSGGPFYGAAASEEINFLIVSKEAVTHVVKYEKIKIISGDLNLAGRGFDGYTIYARIYHDVFVPDNKRFGLYCSVTYTEVTAPAAKLDITLDGDSKIASTLTYPGNKMYLVGTSSDAGNPTVGSTLTNFTLANVGDKVNASTKFFAIEYTSRKVVAELTVTP